MKMEECSETSEHKIQTPGNHPKERTQHSEHGEGFKIKKIKITHDNNSVVSAGRVPWQQRK
jgi:hypothetical protein